MPTAIKSFTVKDPLTVRDDMLRSYRNMMINRGVPNPQIGPGSDAFIWCTILANEIAVNNANLIIKADAQMVDTATGADLDRIGKTLGGLARRGAVGSNGRGTFGSSATSLIPTGAQLIDVAGLRYQVPTGGTYANGAVIPIAAIDTGSGTNQINGTVLRWVVAPPYAQPTVTVGAFGGSDGLVGGLDAENDETFRARILARLQNPPGAGNWSQIAGIAEASTPNVQKAFVYPAANGPGTVHVAVTAAATSVAASNARNRDVDSLTMSAIVSPYITGNVAEYVEVVVTTVTNVPTDMSIGLTLPAAPNATPPGPGGGWLDGTPWPAISGTGSTFVSVTAVTSSTLFTVNAPTAPTAGVSRIAFLDPNTWTINTAKVLSFSGTTGAYVITIDTPFPNIATGNYIFPQAQNQQTYVTALLSALALMGPGEKTSAAGLLPRALRKPFPQVAWPYSLGDSQLRAITNSGTEVIGTSWYARSTTTPALPGSISNPPNIIVPRNIGFYPQ